MTTILLQSFFPVMTSIASCSVWIFIVLAFVLIFGVSAYDKYKKYKNNPADFTIDGDAVCEKKYSF